jgi:hypothetical protein
MVTQSNVRPVVLSCLSLLLIGAMAVPTVAQDRLELLTGKTYSGKILSDDGTTVEIKTSAGTTLKLPYARLTPTSQYRLMRKRTTDDVDSQLDLADWCVDQVLYEEARRHFDAALAADPERAERVNTRLDAAHTKAGREAITRAKALMADGRDAQARGILGRIIQQLPLEPAAKEAAALLEGDKGRRKAEFITPEVSDANADVDPRAGKHATRANGKPYSNRVRKLMGPVIQQYYNIIDRTLEGIVTNSRTNSIELFRGAIKAGPMAIQAVEELKARAEKEEEIAEAVGLAKLKIEEAVVSARVHLAQTLLIGDAIDDAAEVVHGGLTDYPENVRLQELEKRVAAAKASGHGVAILGRRRDS